MKTLSYKELLKIERALGIIEGIAYSKENAADLCLLSAASEIRTVIDQKSNELLEDLREELQG